MTLLDWLFSDLALFLTAFVGTILMIVLTERHGRMQRSRNQFPAFWLIFIVSCGLACFHIHYLGRQAEREQMRIIVELARTSAKTLTRDGMLSHLKKFDESDPAFRKIRDLLVAWANANEDIDSLYLLRREGGQIDIPYFFLKNTARPSPEWTNRYSDLVKHGGLPRFAADTIHADTSYGKVVHSDGTIRQVVAEPLPDANAEAEMILCFEFHDRRALIVQARIWPHLFFLVFLVFVIATQIFFIRRRVFSNKLHDTRVVSYEKVIESLVDVQEQAKRDAEEKSDLFRLINAALRWSVVAVLESSHTQFPHADNPIHSDLVDRITRNKRELHEVIDDLQRFVDLEWDRLTIDKTAFSPERMFREFRDSCQMHGPELGNRTFLLEISKLVPQRIIGDEAKIRYVFERFFDWVLSGVSEGHVKLIGSLSETELYLTAIDSENKTPVRAVAVSDILTSSQQWPALVEPPEKPYGFGMHVASRIVRFLGGTITAHAAMGRGKKYTITIPIELAENAFDEHLEI